MKQYNMFIVQASTRLQTCTKNLLKFCMQNNQLLTNNAIELKNSSWLRYWHIYQLEKSVSLTVVGRRNLGIQRIPWKGNALKRNKCGRRKKPLKRKTANYKPKNQASKKPHSRIQGWKKRPYVFKRRLPHQRRRGHGHFVPKKLKYAGCYFSRWRGGPKCIITLGLDSEGKSIKLRRSFVHAANKNS